MSPDLERIFDEVQSLSPSDRESLRLHLESQVSESKLKSANGGRGTPGQVSQSLAQEIDTILARVPEEVLRKLPEDAAEQHDHYIYGHAKRPQ
jgi:hypothetical protein